MYLPHFPPDGDRNGQTIDRGVRISYRIVPASFRFIRSFFFVLDLFRVHFLPRRLRDTVPIAQLVLHTALAAEAQKKVPEIGNSSRYPCT